MTQPNSHPSYIRRDLIMVAITAVVVIAAMMGLYAIDQRTHFIERMISIPEPAIVQPVEPGTTP